MCRHAARGRTCSRKGTFPCRGKGKGSLAQRAAPVSGARSQRGYSLLKRECPPRPPERETRGDFDFPPHPLETTQRGGLRPSPLETPPGARRGSGSGKRSRGRPICSPGVRCAYRCGDAMPDGTGLAQPVGDFRIWSEVRDSQPPFWVI